MRIISCHRDLLQALGERESRARRAPGNAEADGFGGAGAAGATGTTDETGEPSEEGKVFLTGLDELDDLPPRGAFARGAVHEVLSEPADGVPRFFALLLARSAAMAGGGAVVWSDPGRETYPPALAAGGLPLERVVLLRPRSAGDEVWAMAECLRCRGVSAVVAAPRALSRVQARRLQLAAEHGGGVGLFLRAWDGGGRGGGNGRGTGGGTGGSHYAAATRWLVGPTPGDRDVQRWRVQLIHGHGGRVGRSVVLEVSRGTPEAGAAGATNATDASFPRRIAGPVRVQADPLRAVEMLARRSPAAEKPKVPA